MVHPHIINDARHWRARAEKMRLVAEDMRDPGNRQTALRIADDYDRLARRAEERSSRLSGQVDRTRPPVANN